MPPKLALLLCTAIVIILLRVEEKNGPIVSGRLWVPTIWLLYTASKPLAVWFQLEGVSFESGSPVDRYFLVILLCWALFVLGQAKTDWCTRIKRNNWLMLAFGYMLVSILWSDIPFISLKRWIREVVAVIMALVVATERDSRQATQRLIRRTTYILVPFSLLLIKYFPDYGVDYDRWNGALMWVGVTLQKNSLGRLCLISAFFLIWALVRAKRTADTRGARSQTCADLIVLFLTLWILKGPGTAYSATGIASLLSGLATFVCLLWGKREKLACRRFLLQGCWPCSLALEYLRR